MCFYAYCALAISGTYVLSSHDDEAKNISVVQKGYGRHAWDLTLTSVTNREALVRRPLLIPSIVRHLLTHNITSQVDPRQQRPRRTCDIYH